MKKVLVTGGAGYIGSVISGLLLQSNYKVRAVDALWFKRDVSAIHLGNPNYEFIKADICNYALTDSLLRGIDFVVHAAAVVGEPASKKFPELTQKVNYEAAINLIEKAKEANVKGFIFLSTCSNYGITEGVAKEESGLKALSLYAETKVGVERHLMDKTNGLDWSIARLSTVYGVSPRMRFDLTVNDFTMNAYLKKYIDIFLPLSHRPYIHVCDVAKVIVSMINNFQDVRQNIFNVGFSGENYQKIQIAKTIKECLPETEVEVVKSGTDLRDYQVDFSKLKKYLNMEKTFGIRDGIKQIVELLESGVIGDVTDSIYYNTSPFIEELTKA